MKKLLIIAAISIASLVAAGARAEIIYDGGAPNQAGVTYADRTYTLTEAAETFTLEVGANTISDVHWWGGCAFSTCPKADFILSFYEDDGGTPGALINSYSVGNANQTITGLLILEDFLLDDFPEYSYSTDISALTLTAGTTYWLGISNSTGGDIIWSWEATSDGNSDGHAQFDSSFGWTALPGDLAFFLTGATVAVPEPASLALLGSSLLGFAIARRRKQTG